jgi:acyl-CoA reductase-like NAD-dependent aldehyde dehydrogenase
MEFQERLEKVLRLADELMAHRDELVELAIQDLGFSRRDNQREIEITVDRLKSCSATETFLSKRTPLGEVALALSYNGSAWLNTVISTIFLVGNRIRVKLSSKGLDIAHFLESLYEPIFDDWVTFDHRPGKAFLEEALRNQHVKAICVFGSEKNLLPYEGEVRNRHKRLIFEGPGSDPFIVLQDASIENALEDLCDAKYSYSGQTCTAPENVYVQKTIYEEFLEAFVESSRKVEVGDPREPGVIVTPIGSPLAVKNITRQLDNARKKGARIVLGGKIEGNLVYPTIVADATPDMLGVQEETFGPVSFVIPFDTPKTVIDLARQNRYGLRASVYGGEEAERIGSALKGEPYMHEVPKMVFGKFGTVSVNEPRSISWKGAFVTKAVGGYGYSGWEWDALGDTFKLKQGPKLLSLETSTAEA